MLKVLNKYGYEITLTKTKLYQDIIKYKDLIKDEGFNFHLKTFEELWKYEVILNGLLNKNKIDIAYQEFAYEDSDALKYLNYEEKQTFFNGELADILKEQKHFANIYIPYLEEFINERYLHNYLLITLKQHQKYLKQYPREIDQPFILYGYKPLISTFSSLIALKEDEEHYYFYSEEMLRIYVFLKKAYHLVREIPLTDKYCQTKVTAKEANDLLELYHQDPKQFLEVLLQKALIKQKVYQKALKKLK